MQNMEKTSKHQNNKTSYGVEAFLENNMFFFHTFQKSMIYNDPYVLLEMITLKQSYDQFKFKW
jgi:hypothetical protein